MQTKVSMVVPCYNKEEYIGEMLESVYNQIWDNIELILVNDGSTDGTRHIISQWEPKLRERGYDVIIIDQKNQGVGAAVRDSMLRITGEYVCQADCDDILHPEFVSSRAEWLDQHPDDDGVSCDTDRSSWYFEGTEGLRCHETACVIGEPPISLTQELLSRFATSFCLMMYRQQFLEKRRVLDSFFTEPRASQEPQVFIPIHFHGAKIHHMPKCLYQYRKAPNQISDLKTFEAQTRHYRKFYALTKHVLNAVITDPRENAYYTNICHLGEFILYLRGAIKFGVTLEQPFWERFSQFLNGFVSLPENGADIERQPFILLRAIENAILRQPYYFPAIKKSYRRIIGYGALGQAAKYFLPAAFDTPLHPTVFWDRAAKPGMTLHDIPVEPPDWESLTPDDMLLVFVKDSVAAKQILEDARKTNVGISLFHYDIMDYLAQYYYPEITPESVSVPSERSIGVYDE